ncbi:MAG: cadherin domain-containing protein, partial [Betaproteobacteria bacterium]|nr:cadherin domain-containing protein [Betaproteobacteria bacterium]
SAVGALPDGITFDDDPDSATFRTFTFASSFSGTVLLWVEAMDATSLTSVQSFFVIAAAGGEILPDRAVGQLAVSRQQRKVTIGLALSLQPDSQDVTLALESANDAMLELDIDTMEFSTSNWNDAQELVATMTDAAVAAKMLQTVAISAGVYQSASSDSLYQSTANLSIVVELDSRNQPPRFDAEQVAQIELAIDENLGTIALAAAADIGMPIDEVVDEDNDAFKYRILGTSAEFQIDMDSGQLAAQSDINFNHERTSGYTLTIEVDDQDGGADLVTVQVSVNDLPEAPASYDGSSFMVAGRSRDALTLGWNNTDFYGQYEQQDRGRIAISYGGGGYLATLDLPAIATQATVAGLVPGVSYDLTLHWYSQDGLTQSSPHSSAIISAANVSLNNAPSLASGSLARSLVEQVGDQPPLAAGAVLATVTATDANNDELAYSIVGGADAALFAIDAQSGVISALGPLRLDHETKDSYRFMVQVQDSYGGRDRQQFALMVTDAVEPNQPPQLPDQAAHRAVVGTAYSFSAAAATDPEGDSLVYEIVSINGTITSTAPSWLTFTAATGGFAVATSPSPVPGNYTIAIKAVETGNSPNLETQVKTLVLAVAANDTNERPALAAMFEFNELEENTDYRSRHEVGVVTATDMNVGDVLTYRIYGQDAAEFDVGSSRVTISTSTVTVNGNPVTSTISTSTVTIRLSGARRFDHEMKSSYRFMVEFSDGNPGGVVSAPVVVNIGNVNEAPQFPEIPDQRVVRGTPATFVIPPAVDPDPETGRSLAYSVHTPGPWLTFVGSTRTFTVLPSAPAGLYTLVVVAAEMGGASAPLTGEQDFVVAVHPSGSPLRPQVASLFNQAPEFPDPAPNGRIVVSGTSKVLTLRQASDPEGEALFYGLRNAPSWLVQTSVPWKVIVSPPVGEESGSRLVGLQATDTGSGGTAEDVWRLEVIDPSEFSNWGVVGGRLEFIFDSGWCQGRIERRGSIDIDYGGSAAVSIEPAWESLNCRTPRSVTRQITIGANLHTVGYLFIEVEDRQLDVSELHVSLPMLAAGDHRYDFAVSLQEVLTASGTTTILDLDSAAAALSYTLVDQDFSIAESADPVAGGTALITLTLAGGGVVSSPQWSVHGAPRVSLEVAAVSGSESTEAVVSLGEETVLDYEAGASLVSVTIIARTAASETNQQAVFTDLHLMLTPVDEPPRFPAAFPDQRVRSGTAASFDFHAAEDPEGADLVYTPSNLPTGVTFTSNSTRRFFTVANTVAEDSYTITLTAAEQGNSASSVEQSFVLHVVAAGIVADTTSLVPVTGETQVSGFALQLGSAPTGNVTIELASALSVQLQVSPTIMIFDSGNWNVNQNVRLQLLEAGRRVKSSRSIDVTAAVRDEAAQGDSNYRQAAPVVVPVAVNVANAAPVFGEDQT